VNALRPIWHRTLASLLVERVTPIRLVERVHPRSHRPESSKDGQQYPDAHTQARQSRSAASATALLHKLLRCFFNGIGTKAHAQLAF
jgi:hypothetical protein